VLTTQTRLSSFSEAVRRSATTFLCFASTKQPFVISGSRPQPVCRLVSLAVIQEAVSLGKLTDGRGNRNDCAPSRGKWSDPSGPYL
jgi:hypothetical protein